MTGEETRHLVVGRLRKPHGLKGDCAVFPLTGDPELAFAPGHDVWLIPGEEQNLKITTPSDLLLAQQHLNNSR